MSSHWLRICLVSVLVVTTTTRCRALPSKEEFDRAAQEISKLKATGELVPLEGDLNRVAVEFCKLRAEGKLPGLASSESGGTVSVFKINIAERAKWAEPFTQVRRCSNLFMADVKFSGKHLKYFFCKRGQQTELSGAYQLNGKNWTAISTPKG
jgi:hypothetical protein